MTFICLATRLARLVAVLVCCTCTNVSATETLSTDEENSRSRGAAIFLERCALCHGSKGMGEGPLALLVSGYPATNLITSDTNRATISSAINHGSSTSALSPPWKHELPIDEITAVTEFVELLRNDFNQAMLELASVNISPASSIGHNIFRARCERCHGKQGKGDGTLSRLITNPPPSNLTISTLSKTEITSIVSNGGAAVGRSESMPPWGQELLAFELRSIVAYLFTLRTNSKE